MTTRQWASIAHSVSVGMASAVAVLMVSNDPRALWWAAGVALVSRGVGHYISQRGAVRRRPHTVSDLVVIAQELKTELHAINNKVTTFLAEVDLLAHWEHQKYSSPASED